VCAPSMYRAVAETSRRSVEVNKLTGGSACSAYSTSHRCLQVVDCKVAL
jgi:hypothetical protein